MVFSENEECSVFLKGSLWYTFFMKKKVCCIICMLFVGMYTVSAQTPEPTALDVAALTNLGYNASVNESDIDVIVSPEFPQAYQKVTVRLDSNTVDLNRYIIQWVENGIPKLSGIGKRDFQTTTGAYGSISKINVIINIGPSNIQKNITLSPQDVTVLWEAIDSYVPPFYRGKKMASQESLITVSAIPNFQGGNKSLQTNDAVFLWNRNGNKILNIGGYGKNSITIQHNRLRAQEEITTEVSTVSGSTNAKKSIIIPIGDPEIHWYAKNSNDYRRLSTINNGLRVAGGDIKIMAEPYFFSTNRNLQGVNMVWKMNNENLYLEKNNTPHEILVRNPDELGQTNFSVAVTSKKTFLQEVSDSLSIYFQ
jgi:hypothetical protein